MKKNYLSMFMALAMTFSGAAFLASCEKTPQDNGNDVENEGGNKDEDNQGGNENEGGNEEQGTFIDVKAGDDLQAAIFSAAPGTTVRVQGGVTFKGNIKFVEGVTLSGGWNATFTQCGAEDLENLTVIDAQNSGRALEQHRIKPEGSDAYADYVTPTVVSGFELKGGNTDNGAGAWIRKNGILEYCYIHDNTATSGGGGVRIEAGGIVRNCEISNNVSNNNGGGAYVYGTLENCELTFNTANNNCGGGAQIHAAGQMINCTVAKNSAKNGGGIRVYSNGGLIAGCLVAGNTATETGKQSGTGVVLNGNCSVVNWTIVANISNAGVDTQYGPGLYFGDSSSDSPVKNCIIWGNKQNGDATGRQIKGTRTGIENCAVAGGDTVDPYVIDLSYNETATTGTDGIDTWDRPAPGFVAASSNIFRLMASSVLVDKGVNSHLPEALVKDIEGEDRISGANVDLGAFEYQK